MLTVVRS